MVIVDGVCKTFREGLRGRKVQALQGVSVSVHQGEVFGFLGLNGAGKSTTIKVLLNLIRPDVGKATILGRDVRDPSVRNRVGFLPENPYFYDYLTGEELLWFGGRASGVAKKVLKKRIPLLMEQVGLTDAGKRHLRTYSKGMVQRAGLALAIVHDPDVVILDEPMSGLDPLGRKMVGDMILSLRGEGKTVFFSSHILNDIERFCDRIGIIAKGRLRLTGKLSELVSSEDTLERLFLRSVSAEDGGQIS
ncbi:ABC transporter, ATP-binding protein [Syntrophotalea carbinolica DSM 2380]|uniref:ABC transporter, ATP-binding protein n=1 Tax=Syntrophotalea carbinolica (strain DSM 2380 / NBRC 103641 / GraBd1) TaxID=338963 RepID=Q3A2M6_SYNC1|nr:ABC transporter ATP-binding protein [Syntrophotalea carbinolica]ABA89381.1 ABC transporter, ATP-binding protein [Syntrophotalea carbinolica DSM 2380]